MHTVFSKNKKLSIPDEEWEQFCARHAIVEAAGGLVQNSRDEYLMIFRNGRWDLPKGKRETNESMEQTAIREVQEECGIDRLRLERLLTVTHHAYTQHGVEVLKPTHWYAMRYEGSESVFTPQTEEGIEAAKFIAREKIVAKCFKNCYDNIREVFAAAGFSLGQIEAI
jgi:8-oxo-dGTP pyrophosphatase MutT (NUDIX family)